MIGLRFVLHLRRRTKLKKKETKTNVLFVVTVDCRRGALWVARVALIYLDTTPASCERDTL